MRHHRDMRWFWLCLLLGGALHARAIPLESLPITTAVDGCAEAALPIVSVAGSTLRLSGLAANRQYLIELHEHGIDLRVAADATKLRWINSEPWAYATEPVQARSDANGDATLELRIANHFAWAKLQVLVTCLDDNAAQRVQSLQRRARIARQVADVNAMGDETAAFRALVEAWKSLWYSDRASSGRLWTLLQLAQLASWGGLGDEQIAWAKLARQEAEVTGDAIRATFALSQIGGVLLAQGKSGVDAVYLQVIADADRLKLPDLSARAANGRCIVLRTVGDAAGAANCYQSTIKRFAQLGDLSAEGRARNTRATALLFEGRYAQAKQELELAASLAKRSDNEMLAARVWLVQAQVARWSGEFERALMLLNEALTLHRRLGRVDDIARVERQVAQTYELAQEPARAEHFFKASLVSAQQRGDGAAVADLQVSLARLSAARADFVASLGLLDVAITFLSRDPNNSSYAVAMLQRADVELAAGRQQAARATLKQLADSARSLPWRYQVRLDALRLRAGNSAALVDVERSLLPAAEQALAKGDLTLFLELSEAIYTVRDSRGDHLGALETAMFAVERGINVAARVRSPTLRNSLLSKLKLFAAAPFWQLNDGPLDPPTARSALTGLESLRAVEQTPFAAEADEDTLVELERGLADAAASAAVSTPERERLLLRLTAKEASTLRAESGLLRPPGATAQEALAVGQFGSLFYLVMGADRAGVLTFDHRGWRWRGDLDAPAIQGAARSLQVLLKDAHGPRDAIDAQVSALAAALKWSTLFEVAPKRLISVFDGSLATLPIGLLPAPGGSAKYLIETTELAVMQSLRPRPATAYSRLHLGAASAGGINGLPELAASTRELAEVSALWPQLAQKQRSAMTRTDLAVALADPASLVHLAAHGRGDGGRVEDAGLWLAKAGGSPDFVSALRLRRMPVAAELVVLGACDTAASASGRSLGVGGVAGSLVDAGAGAVVATRWPVSDRVAQLFAVEFHRRLSAMPQAQEAALNGAVLALRRTPFGRHPTHWAGWFLLRSGPPTSEQFTRQNE